MPGRKPPKERPVAAGQAGATRSDDSHPPADPPSSDSDNDEPTLRDIQKSITTSTALLNGKLDSISQEFATFTVKLADLEKSVSMNSDKLIEIEQKKIPDIESKMAAEIASLHSKLTLMEIYGRRLNLLFYGVKEVNNEDVLQSLHNTLSHLGIHDAANIPVVNVHRLPRREPTTASQPPAPRCIIAKFVYMKDRNRILSAFEERHRQPQQSDNADASATERSRITVRTDLPPALKARRSSLARVAYNLRKEKKVSTKISVVGTNVQLHWKEKGTTTWNLHRD